MSDRELLELAAKAAGLNMVGYSGGVARIELPERDHGDGWVSGGNMPWNPLSDDGERYRLARKLGISIDFADCCAWKRLANGDLIQEFWGGECGDEAHAVVRAAAEIGRRPVSGM